MRAGFQFVIQNAGGNEPVALKRNGIEPLSELIRFGKKQTAFRVKYAQGSFCCIRQTETNAGLAAELVWLVGR